MDVKIQSVNFEADPSLVTFVEGRMGKINQFFDRITGAEVFLKVEKKESHENKVAEIRVAIPGKDVFARKQCDSFEEATDEAVEAVIRQIKKHKGKALAKH